MTKFESSVKQIPHSQKSVYAMLSDLNNIQRLKDHLPDESVGNEDMDKVRINSRTLVSTMIPYRLRLILLGKFRCVS